MSPKCLYLLAYVRTLGVARVGQSAGGRAGQDDESVALGHNGTGRTDGRKDRRKEGGR